MADETKPAGHPNGPGRESRNNTESDGLRIRIIATGVLEVKSASRARALIASGQAEVAPKQE